MASNLFIFYHDETQTSRTQKEGDNQSLAEDTNTIRTTDEKGYFEFVYDEEKQQSILVKYPCNICEKEFKSGRNLAIHIKSKHEGLECQQCQKQFTCKDGLKGHIKSIHEGIKYACNQCDYQAKAKYSLTKHTRRNH